jgi:phage terminase large subunit GpA-like protein
MGARDDSTALLDAEQLVADLWRQYLAPPPRLSVTQWAERHRILSGKDSAEPGPYRVARTPYAREPQDALSATSPVEQVVLIWGSQTAKTTIGLNWIGYTIHLNPGPFMVMWPTINVAKRNSRQRVTPMIDATPVLRGRVSERKSRDEANTTLLKDFSGGVLAIVGANSGSDLSSMPMRDIFMDEVDRFPADIPGEGRPTQLAEARQTTFSRRKRLVTSTPTTKGFSEIEALYEASDRSRYHVPCPHCGEMQALEWGASAPWGVKWDRRADGTAEPSSVRYVCRANGCEIKEHHKPAMLAGGAWVAANPEVSGKTRGFHLSSLYSPLGWLSWSQLVVEWERAMAKSREGDASMLRVFVNTRLAETFEEQGDKADEHALRKRAEDIPLRVVTWGHYVMTMGADVQGDRLEAYLWAWGRGMERQLVDRAVFYGDPAIPEGEPGSPWTALTEYRRTPVLHASGRPVPILATFCDSGGHHTQAVYDYARRHQHAHVYAVKGSSIGGKNIVGKPTDQDITWRGQRMKHGVKLWPIGTDTAKQEIYGRLRLTEPGPGYVHLSRHLPPEVFEQLTSERLVTKYVKGRQRLEWLKPAGRRNEALDCAVYALAAAHFAGVERWREGDWAKWQARVEARDLFDAAPPPPPPVAVSVEPAESASSGPAPPPVPEPAQAAPPAAPARRMTYRPKLPSAGGRRW